MSKNKNEISDLYEEVLDLHRLITDGGLTPNELRKIRQMIHSKNIAIQMLESQSKC